VYMHVKLTADIGCLNQALESEATPAVSMVVTSLAAVGSMCSNAVPELTTDHVAINERALSI